jgi:hypothetical protein
LLSWLQSTLRTIPVPFGVVCPNKGDTVNAEMSPMVAMLMFIAPPLQTVLEPWKSVFISPIASQPLILLK